MVSYWDKMKSESNGVVGNIYRIRLTRNVSCYVHDIGCSVQQIVLNILCVPCVLQKVYCGSALCFGPPECRLARVWEYVLCHHYIGV